VINYQGGISPRYPAESPIIQRVLLEAEGVSFDVQERIELARYRWHPQVQAAKNHRRRTKYPSQSAIIHPLYDKH
jgi:hypothetical protein